jgi:GNAT superfamily N-acetyltransferase
VRLRVGDDLAPATELLLRFFAEEGFTTDQATIAANVRTLAGLETCALFVAEADGACVGVATVSLEFGVEFGWWAEMGDLYVIPEARGRGVSLALVAAIEDFLRQRRIPGYQVTVTPDSGARHGLKDYYRRLGFAGDGRLLLFKRL